MIIDKITRCWSGIRRIFRIFIFEYDTYNTFAFYTNLLYISIFGFVNGHWFDLYRGNKYFKKFLMVEP
jgi:hypothetical protein